MAEMMRVVRLLLILGQLQGSLSQTIFVAQNPTVSSTPGSTVTLQCNYNFSSGNIPNTSWFRWFRHVPNGPEVSESSPGFVGRVSRVNEKEFINNRSASIDLHRVDPTDTGIYICQVGIYQNDKIISGHGKGTFLTVTGSFSQTIQVFQIPAVMATLESKATLQCNYVLGSTEKPRGGWFRWYRHIMDGPGVSDTDPDFMGRVTQVTEDDFYKDRLANLYLHRVSFTDTGFYICHISLQFEKMTVSGHGNGTFLHVTDPPEKKSTPKQNPIIIQNLVRIALSFLILAVALPVLLCYDRKGTGHPTQKQKAAEQSQTVIDQTVPSHTATPKIFIHGQ